MLRSGGRTRAITVFPSTTSVAYLPFLTGCTPGRCNIPSIRWLDRSAYGGRWWREREAVRSYCGYQAPRLDADIAADVRTIFELVPESVGIFTPVARGLTPARDPSRRERQLWGALAHYAQWHQPSDDAVARHLLRAVGGASRFVFAQFPAVDGYSHQTDPDADPVRRALRKVDAVVGRLRERLRGTRRAGAHARARRERPRRGHGPHPPRSGGVVPGAGRADAVASGTVGTASARRGDGGRKRLGHGVRAPGGAEAGPLADRAAAAA